MWSILRDGPAVVNLSEVARCTGHSRSTIYRALTFFKRFGKVITVDGYHVGQAHPGRPIKYRLNPAYSEEIRESATAQEKGISSKRVSPSTIPQEELQQNLPRPATGPVTEIDTRENLTRWLGKADVSQFPTDREKRKLSHAIRERVSPSVADPLLDALWWKTKARLQLWRDVISAIKPGVSALDVPKREMLWRIRTGLQRLERNGDRRAFLQMLEGRSAEQQKGRIQRRLRGLSKWHSAQGEEVTGQRLSWFVEHREALKKEQQRLESRHANNNVPETAYPNGGGWVTPKLQEESTTPTPSPTKPTQRPAPGADTGEDMDNDHYTNSGSGISPIDCNTKTSYEALHRRRAATAEGLENFLASEGVFHITDLIRSQVNKEKSQPCGTSEIRSR